MFDFTQHLYRQRAFSRATFGPGDRTVGVTDHIAKELVEVRQARDLCQNSSHDERSFKASLPVYALPEWIDIVILGLDGALRTGATPEQIVDELLRKQERNEMRNWPDWRTADPDKAIEHVRTEEAA